MALSGAEESDLLQRIGAFLRDEFSPVLAHYYAESVAFSERHPQNINNELRNALTHMARALCADNMAKADSEMAAASRHVERFKRDCLKISVIYAGQDAARMIRHVDVAQRRLAPELHLECASIVLERYRVLTAEVLGDAGAAANWEALLLRVGKLRERLIAEYPFLDDKGSKAFWLLTLGWRVFASIAGFIILTILGAALVAMVIPDGKEFKENAQGVIVQTTGALFGTNSDSDSAAEPNADDSANTQPTDD